MFAEIVKYTVWSAHIDFAHKVDFREKHKMIYVNDTHLLYTV